MLLVTFFVPLVVLATRVVAGPTVRRDSHSRISFPISRHINGNGKIDLIQRDRKDSVKDDSQRRSSSTPELVVNDTTVVYGISVGIGEPPNTYNLIIDTAGANTWVGSEQTYQTTSSSVKTSDTVTIYYTTSASVEGDEYTDTVTFAPEFSISQQSIGVTQPDAGGSGGVYPFDGMLGIGPKNLSVGTLNPDKSSAIPTVTDNLFAQQKISQNLVAFSVQPYSPTTIENGEMTFGDTDPGKYTGQITYFPTTTTVPASNYWGVDASFRYGNSLVILNPAAGVIDTITNLILVTSDAYNSYASATGGVLDEETGLLGITSAQYDNLQSLYFNVGGTTYEITKNAQIYPRAWNRYIGGAPDGIYLIVQDIKYSRQPSGMGFVLGRPFLERFYIVLDSGNSSVGFATTQFTQVETN